MNPDGRSLFLVCFFFFFGCPPGATSSVQKGVGCAAVVVGLSRRHPRLIGVTLSCHVDLGGGGGLWVMYKGQAFSFAEGVLQQAFK